MFCKICKKDHYQANFFKVYCELAYIKQSLQEEGLFPLLIKDLRGVVKHRIPYKIAPFWKKAALWVPKWYPIVLCLKLDKTSTEKLIEHAKADPTKFVDSIKRVKKGTKLLCRLSTILNRPITTKIFYYKHSLAAQNKMVYVCCAAMSEQSPCKVGRFSANFYEWSDAIAVVSSMQPSKAQPCHTEVNNFGLTAKEILSNEVTWL